MYYFASDVHLGHGPKDENAAREARFVRWLDEVAGDAKAIFLVGDIFDFWFEYGKVAPKGSVRTLGKLAELSDRGIQIHFFIGNHDMWTGDYLQHECGMTVHRGSLVTELAGKKVYIAHGDNLGKRPAVTRFMNWVFRSKCIKSVFSALLHPDLAIRFGEWWSGSSRKAGEAGHHFRGENEPLLGFARDYLASHPDIDLLIFGHIHVPITLEIGPHTQLAFLGEWIKEPAYGVLDENGFTLKNY